MNLRERCEKAWFDAHEQYLRHGNIPVIVDVVEAFAREIRNEALEEAAKEAIRYTWREGAGCADAIRAIALIAAENET